MLIRHSVINEILHTVGGHPPETGGILAYDDNHVITKFQFDLAGVGLPYKYTPSTQYLNGVINNEWRLSKLAFCGVVHSHPNNNRKLSQGDLIYAEKMINCFTHLESIFLFVVTQTNQAIAITYYEVSVQNGICTTTEILPEYV